MMYTVKTRICKNNEQWILSILKRIVNFIWSAQVNRNVLEKVQCNIHTNTHFQLELFEFFFCMSAADGEGTGH